MDNGQRRYQIYLSNEGGPPIDVFVVSPYSDGPVSSEDWVAQPLPPSSPLPLLQVFVRFFLCCFVSLSISHVFIIRLFLYQ